MFSLSIRNTVKKHQIAREATVTIRLDVNRISLPPYTS